YLGVVQTDVAARVRHSTVREEVYVPASWAELTGDGSIRGLLLTNADSNRAFQCTEPEGIDEAPPEQADATFIDLYATYLNVPTVGRNLLGDNQYRFLMEDLKP